MKEYKFDFKKELISLWFNEYWDNKGHIKIGELDVIDKSMCLNYFNLGVEEKEVNDKQLTESSNKYPKEDFVNRKKFIEHYFAGREKISLMTLSQQKETLVI